MRKHFALFMTLMLTAVLAIAGTAIAEDAYIEGDWLAIDRSTGSRYGTIIVHFYGDGTGAIECQPDNSDPFFINLHMFYRGDTGEICAQIVNATGSLSQTTGINVSLYYMDNDSKTLQVQIEDGFLTLTDSNADYVRCVASEDVAQLGTLYPASEQLLGDWQSIPSSASEPVMNMTFAQDRSRAIIMASAGDSVDNFIIARFWELQGKLFLMQEATGETNTMTYQLSQDGQSLSLTENGYTINFIRTTFEPSLGERIQAINENNGKPDIPDLGDIITFGAYPQTAEGTDSSPIEWYVLDKDGDKVLLISRFGLDMQPYNKDAGDTTWAECTLRTWLNDTFLNRAFTPEEQKKIVTTNVPNDKSQCHRLCSSNGGIDTQDKIFLLSCKEAEEYYDLNDAQFYGDDVFINTRVAPTAYAMNQGADIYSFTTKDGASSGWWWLRSPGRYQNLAAYILPNGKIGNIDQYAGWDTVDVMVRPALWVRITDIPATEDGANNSGVNADDETAMEEDTCTDWELRTMEGDTICFMNKEASEAVIPEGVTSIGSWAFKKCTSLASITIPDSVTSIQSWAFYQCTSLTSIAIPDSVTSIEKGTFYECTSLTSITIPDSVTSIEASAFSGCIGLTSITIPNSVTSMSVYAFEGCTSLTSIIVTPDSYAEQYCKDNNLPCTYAEGNP